MIDVYKRQVIYMRKRTPLYLDSLEAAQKKGREEVDKYLASYKANVGCAEDIKRTIYYYYDGFRLPDGFEDRVLDTYCLLYTSRCV